jgi:hypothetical protein
MSETQFADTVAGWLTSYVAGCEVATKKSVLYALSFDEQGQIQLGVDAAGEPVRGGGTGFEQDILIFERVQGGATSIIPRVIAEVKFGRVTTHDALTYAEKARRIRIIYPFVVHRHFPWLRPKTGTYRFALPRQYAAPGIDTTESDDEPIMCDIGVWQRFVRNWAISRYWFSPIAFQCQQTSLVSRPLGHHVGALVSGKS